MSSSSSDRPRWSRVAYHALVLCLVLQPGSSSSGGGGGGGGGGGSSSTNKRRLRQRSGTISNSVHQQQKQQQPQAAAHPDDALPSLRSPSSFHSFSTTTSSSSLRAIPITTQQQQQGQRQLKQMIPANKDDEEPPIPIQNRIVNGRNVYKSSKEFPFFGQWYRGCGATLIHNDVMLTAAHCYSPQFRDHQVRFEGRSKDLLEVVDARVHPKFNDETNWINNNEYDFMLLRLSRPIPQIKPIPVHSSTINWPLRDQEDLTIVGYGLTAEDGTTATILQEATVQYHEDCSFASYRPEKIGHDTMFCAHGYYNATHSIDSCQGDSGGPIMRYETGGVGWIQVGVTSWGEGCARPHSPGIYARTAVAYDWIQSTLCELSRFPPPHCGTSSNSNTPNSTGTSSSSSSVAEEILLHVLEQQQDQDANNNNEEEQAFGDLVVTAPEQDVLASYEPPGSTSTTTATSQSIAPSSNGDADNDDTDTDNDNSNSNDDLEEEEQQEKQDEEPLVFSITSLRIDVDYDDYPQEISWALAEQYKPSSETSSSSGSSTLIHVSRNQPITSRNKRISQPIANVPKGSQYKLEFYDTISGDGIVPKSNDDNNNDNDAIQVWQLETTVQTTLVWDDTTNMTRPVNMTELDTKETLLWSHRGDFGEFVRTILHISSMEQD